MTIQIFVGYSTRNVDIINKVIMWNMKWDVDNTYKWLYCLSVVVNGMPLKGKFE